MYRLTAKGRSRLAAEQSRWEKLSQAIAGLMTPNLLLVAAVCLALGTSLETPSRQAIVPNLVPREDLASGIALNNAQRSAATILGPALAGLLIATSGPGLCYVVDAISWFAMFGALALIRQPLQLAARGAVSLRALAEGISFVRSQQVVLAFMVLDFGATFFGSSNALLPIYARDIMQVGPQGLGILYAASAIGALATATLLGTSSRITRAGRWVLIGVALYAVCMVGFALSDMFWLSVLFLAGTGAGNMLGAVLRGTSNQTLTPDALRGRVAAVNTVFVTGGPQLGSV
jgi:MFS family permease